MVSARDPVSADGGPAYWPHSADCSCILLATKLDAFHGRGGKDIAGSHDFEDAVAVIDGRREIVCEVRGAEAQVRDYVSSEFQRLLNTRAFLDALPGFLFPDPASQAREPMLLERLKALAGLQT